MDIIEEALKELREEEKVYRVKKLQGVKTECYTYQMLRRSPKTIIESMNEEIVDQFKEDSLGGIITFSTDVNSKEISSNKLVNWVKQKFLTLKNRMTVDKRVNKLSKEHNLRSWTVGRYLRGRYASENGVFDENSLSIEISGITKEELIDFAEDLCKEFNQETVLVKCYNDRSIFLVNEVKTSEKDEAE